MATSSDFYNGRIRTHSETKLGDNLQLRDMSFLLTTFNAQEYHCEILNILEMLSKCDMTIESEYLYNYSLIASRFNSDSRDQAITFLINIGILKAGFDNKRGKIFYIKQSEVMTRLDQMYVKES